MAYRAKTYTLKEEAAQGGIRYSIRFKDRQGECQELEVSENLFFEFGQMECRDSLRKKRYQMLFFGWWISCR